jgi:phosphoribosylamine--glycine ligase
VVEFNVRFGDPETQVILPLLETDLLEIMLATVKGELSSLDIKWKQGSAVCVVMAAPGYPGDYPKGAEIEGLPAADTGDESGLLVFHAGTRQEAARILTCGGRVLGVTGIGAGLTEARDAAYTGVKKIHFEGAHYRTDIAAKALRHV